MFLQHNRSCSVFVGNIPYDVNEDQLKQIFSQVGPVVSFRLMHDKATGRPKGFGFCEYSDQDTAYAAMRNLNNVECSGRPLRVDWADHELRNTEGVQRAVQKGGSDPARAKVNLENEILNIFRSKMADENTTELSYDVQTFAEISSIITQMETVLLFELIGHAQRFVKQFPESAREYFAENPTISLALCQTAYLLGLTSSPVLPMTPEDIIYAEERIQILREKGLSPEKPHELNSANFLSSISCVLTDTRAYGGLVGGKVLAAGASVAGVRATTIGTLASVETIKGSRAQ